MKRPRILVVDDEPDVLELLRHHLARDRYEVATAADGETALKEARRKVPDLVVLDLMLPGIDGLEVCRRLRSDPATSSIPIVMLTAKAEETDAVVGLAHGADDYVRKPFGVKELVARIAARLRHAGAQAAEEGKKVLRWGDLVVDSIKHEVTLRDEPIRLTMTEFKLLRHLVRNAGRAYTRNELLDAVIGQDAIVVDRNVDVHVASLRKKLGPYGRHLLTLRGLGYKFREGPETPD
ncbi:MAG TPA: response regulator transcription factor [Planctomycetota bacterium]|nr:response regulator transcription factor [Planctomycetota bacterium]